jgi:hypothetical protein
VCSLLNGCNRSIPSALCASRLSAMDGKIECKHPSRNRECIRPRTPFFARGYPPDQTALRPFPAITSGHLLPLRYELRRGCDPEPDIVDRIINPANGSECAIPGGLAKEQDGALPSALRVAKLLNGKLFP